MELCGGKLPRLLQNKIYLKITNWRSPSDKLEVNSSSLKSRNYTISFRFVMHWLSVSENLYFVRIYPLARILTAVDISDVFTLVHLNVLRIFTHCRERSPPGLGTKKSLKVKLLRWHGNDILRFIFANIVFHRRTILQIF